MKRIIVPIVILFFASLVGCGIQNTEPTLSPVEIARNDVIDKWTTAEGELGTARFIEDIYKEYPTDSVA